MMWVLRGGHQNGLKGSHCGAIQDRSGSFREGSEGRSFGSGMSTTLRGSALSSGCLLLNPIPVVDHKYTRTGEARRAFRMSASGSSEDGSFGAAQSKLPSPMNTEELKWFKASVTDVFFKARGRIKRLNESLLKLDNYSEALYSKKPQRYESQDEESGIPASSHSLRPLESILRRQDEEFSFEESCSVVYDRDTDIS